jgi:hypothetical protein
VSWLALLTLILIAIPGLARDAADVRIPSFYVYFGLIDHGWPFTFLTRNVDANAGLGGQGIDEAKLAGVHWRLWDGEVEAFSPVLLAADLVAAFACVVLVTAAWEWRRRRRAHVGQLRLGELLIATAAVAGVCGWLAHERRAWRAEQTHLQALQASQPPYAESLGASFAPSRACLAPRWVRLLAGPLGLPEFLDRTTMIRIGYDSDQAYEGFADALGHLQQLEKLRVIAIYAQTQRKPIPFEDLGEIAQLEVLDLALYADLDADKSWNVLPEELAALGPLQRLILPARTSLRPDAAQMLRERNPQCEVVFAEDE